jgi:hypothetical protein
MENSKSDAFQFILDKVLRVGLMVGVVSFKLLASAQVICNIVCVQVQGQIHRELRHENQFLSKSILS